MTNYSNRMPSDAVKSLFERFFPSVETISVRGDRRIVELNAVLSEDREDTMTFYESAIINGFTNGGWNHTNEIMFNEVNILRSSEEMPILSGTPIEHDDIVNIISEDGQYIAQKYRNSILVFTSLDNLTSSGLKSILSTYGYEHMDDREYFAEKMKGLMLAANRMTLERARVRSQEIDSQLEQMYNEYSIIYNERNELNRQLQGMESFDGELRERMIEQFERLLRSSYIESVEIEGDNIICITKPVILGIWNIGTFEVRYNPREAVPTMKRISLPTGNNTSFNSNGDTFGVSGNHAPHVSSNRPCTGNARDFIEDFWRRDMLTGFNHVCQYLRSYSRRRGPYMRLKPFLNSLGYQNDVRILSENNIEFQLIDDGVMYTDSAATVIMSEEHLRELGCTGIPISDPNELEELLINSARGQRENVIGSIEYHEWTQQRDAGEVAEEAVGGN